MDYKEKLKAIINSNKTPFVDIDTFLKYFPELKESEDERIRKALMQNLKERFGTKGNMGEGLNMPDVLNCCFQKFYHASCTVEKLMKWLQCWTIK